MTYSLEYAQLLLLLYVKDYPLLPRRSHFHLPSLLEPSVMELMLKPEPSRWVRYSVAILLVLLALFLMLLIDRWVPMNRSPFLLLFAAVMGSAWYGGLGAGLCAVTIASLAVTYCFMPPAYTWVLKDSADIVRLGLFVLISLLIISLSAARRQLVEALRHERDLMTAIVGTAGSLIIVLDRWGRIVQFNRACETLTGYTFAEVQGEYFWDLFLVAEEIKPVKQVFQTLCVDAAPSTYENYWLTKDGRRFLIAWSNNVLLDERGAVSCIISAGLDITDRKQAERSLQETNQALQALVQAAPVAITVLDRRGIVKLWNPAAETIFGWQAEETIDRPMPTVPAAKQTEFFANIAATLSGNVLNGMETYRQRRDGALLYVSIWTAVLRGMTAEEDGILSIVADLSDRKQAETALKLSQERLHTLTEANVIGILFGDISGGINEANDEFLRIIGYSRADFQAGTLQWTTITPAEYIPLDETAIQEAQTGKGCTPYEKEYIRKDGSRVPVLIGFGLLGEARQKTVAFILDLTERKRLEQTLRTQTEALAQANRLKDEFLAVLSHELRTPLNSILGWSQLLRTRPFDPATTTRVLETIERNARLQNQLINDILDVSTITQGKLRLEIQPVDLATIVAAAIETMRPAAMAKSIAVRYRETVPTALIVMGDPDRLQQAVWNLLSNAIKFTPEGGRVDVQLAIVHKPVGQAADGRMLEAGVSEDAAADVSAQALDDGQQTIPYAHLTVTDTGKGISAVFLPFVFDRFRQADSSSTRAEGGLGLGLAIVRHLVELHGGTVAAASPGIGQGASIVIALPLMVEKVTAISTPTALSDGFVSEATLMSEATNSMDDRAIPALTTPVPQTSDSSLHGVAAAPLPESVALLAGLHILIVDDEPDTRAFLQTAMAYYGAIVTLATSAAEALRLLTQPLDATTQSHKIDALVSDIGLPDEDGYTLIRKVRALGTAQGTFLPALALTAYATEDDRQRALTSGFQRHLAKPIDPAAIAQAIAELVFRQEKVDGSQTLNIQP